MEVVPLEAMTEGFRAYITASNDHLGRRQINSLRKLHNFIKVSLNSSSRFVFAVVPILLDCPQQVPDLLLRGAFWQLLPLSASPTHTHSHRFVASSVGYNTAWRRPSRHPPPSS